jgi:glycosyltransferase involved in cell wall biosynthesis
VIAAIDATPLTISSGGVRRYTEELLRALRTNFPEDEFYGISDQLQTVRGLNRRWWTIGVQRARVSRPWDVFHGTDFSVPYLPLKPSVMTLHDLSPWLDRSWHHGAGRVRRRAPFLIKLGIATMVITQTEVVRKQAIDHFRIPPNRVVAVHIAASEMFRPVNSSRSERPYFLYVGTIEPRKNVPALVSAWREVRQRHDVDLVIAGRRREDGPEIAPEPGLRLLGEMPDQDLPRLYSGAVACVYPTLYEGFGLPVLEAMQCGTPVITSEDPAVMEVSAGAALHVPPERLTEAMELLMAAPAERQRRRAMSLRRAADFSWSATARQTRDVYYEAIRRFHG